MSSNSAFIESFDKTMRDLSSDLKLDPPTMEDALYKPFDVLISKVDDLKRKYTVREMMMVVEAIRYAEGYKPGLPGHALLLTMSKMAKDLGWGIGALDVAIIEKQSEDNNAQ